MQPLQIARLKSIDGGVQLGDPWVAVVGPAWSGRGEPESAAIRLPARDAVGYTGSGAA